MQAADEMVSNGMKEAGYEYINLVFLLQLLQALSAAPSPLWHDYSSLSVCSSSVCAAGRRCLPTHSCWRTQLDVVGWAVGRDNNSVLLADPKLFPKGIKALADYIHAKGLKFGVCCTQPPWFAARGTIVWLIGGV